MSSSQNINISLKHKPSIINGSSAMSYSPSSHIMPALFQHGDSFVHQRELESAFCSDLVCCGMKVRDLHDLLHHYEEHHHSHHHAPIEEVESKEIKIEEIKAIKEIEEDDDDVMMDDLPTQPHELAALTSSPLLHRISTTVSPIGTPMNLSPTSQVFNNTNYFRSEALYQTYDDGQDKPYKCPISNCDKSYKNPNGLKYHQMHGHSEQDSLTNAERDAQKPYMCTIGYCNKRYKNLNGLKYHIEHSHIAKLNQVDQQPWQ